MANGSNDAYLILTIFVAIAVVAVVGMVGYLVWESNQPPGWTVKWREALSKPLFGSKDVSKPDMVPFADTLNAKTIRENMPCMSVNADLSNCQDIDFSAKTGVLTANCRDLNGNLQPSLLNVNNCDNCAVVNVNGVLGCAQGTKTGQCSSLGGNWLDQCTVSFNPSSGAIVAECPDAEGRVTQSSFNISLCNSASGCLINNVNGFPLCQNA